MTGYVLAPETIQRFAGSLLHFIWQGAAIALLTSICLRLFQRRSAELRYTVSVTALIGMLMAPLLTFVFYQETGALALQLLQLTGKTLADAGSSAYMTQAAATAAWTQWIVAAWSLGTFAFTARIVAGWRVSRRFVRDSETVIPQSVLKIFTRLHQQMELMRPIQLLINAGIDTPMVVGCLKPMVLVPLSALTGLSEEQLTAILAHELAHIRRHDFLINILQRCVESLLFYHPGVWWLSARIRAEREHCCDDDAIRVCGDRRIYIQALIELERKRQAAPSLSVAATDGSMAQRVHRILGIQTSSSDWQSAAATLAFVLVWLFVGAWQSPFLVAKPVVSSAVVTAPPPEAIPTAVRSLAAIVTAQQVPAALTQSATPADKGTVRGIVVLTGSGSPLPGVKVSLIGGPADPEAIQRLVTFFAARGIQVSAPLAGQATDAFVQSLRDQASARGLSMVNPDVQNAFSSFDSANRARFSTVTDIDGRFSIASVLPGDYIATVQREDYYRVSEAKRMTVSSGGVADVRVTMTPGVTITGRISNASGRPLANTLVESIRVVYQNGYPVQQSVTGNATDDRGEYRLFGLPPGQYFIAASYPPVLYASPAQTARTFYPGTREILSAMALTVRGGEERPGISFNITDAASFRISGEITSSVPPPTAPTPGIAPGVGPTTATITLVPSDPNSPEGIAKNYGTVTLVPKTDGVLVARFQIDGVLPGSYDVGSWIRESNPDGGSGMASVRQQIEVRDKNIDGIHLHLAPSVRVQGVVTVDGRALKQAAVRVEFQPDGRTDRAARTVVVNPEDGTFMIPAVMFGRFRIQVTQSISSDLYVADVLQNGLSVYDSGFTVTAEQPAPFQISLKSGGGTVEGTVQDATGQPIANATVVIVPPVRRRLNRSLYRVATSDANGRFSIKGVFPQSYKVFAWQGNPQGAFYDSRFLANDEDRAREITVTPSSATTTTVTAIPPTIQ